MGKQIKMKKEPKNSDGISKHEKAKKNFMNAKKNKGNKGNYKWDIDNYDY